ncbi:MAG: hypothetical protein AAF918_16950 [Pseudomonadota bacterium]
MPEAKVIRTTHRVVKPHATIANISYCLDRHANEHERGSALFRMAGLVLEAFYVEGYATVVAENLGRSEELMAVDGTKDRLKAIFKAADPEADFGRRPYQTILSLFRFRDRMAHPRVEELSEEKTLTSEEADASIENVGWNVATETEAFCTKANALLVRQDVQMVVQRTWSTDWNGSPLDSGMQVVGHEYKG